MQDDSRITKDEGNGIMTFDLPGDGKPVTPDIAAPVDHTPEEIAKMRRENPTAFRGIVKHSITGLLENSSKIIAKSSLAYERNQRKIGRYLKEARRSFKTTSEFLKWRGENFPQHIRILQEAEEFAELKKFAEDFEGIGKNPLLAFGRIRHDDEVIDFMRKKPAPVVNPEKDIKPRKIYANSVIIFKKFHDREVILTPEQATAIATKCNKPLEINAVNIVADRINEQPTNELKATFIEEWIENGCLIDREKPAKKSPNLNGIIAQLKNITEKSKTSDSDVLNEIREDDIIEAYSLILNLADKNGISLPPPNQDGKQSEPGDTDKPGLSNVFSLEHEKIAQVG